MREVLCFFGRSVYMRPRCNDAVILHCHGSWSVQSDVSAEHAPRGDNLVVVERRELRFLEWCRG